MPTPAARKASVLRALHEVLTGRTMVILAGGLLVGWLMGGSVSHSLVDLPRPQVYTSPTVWLTGRR